VSFALTGTFLVTLQVCFQVKTNKNAPADFWLLNAHCGTLRSDSYVYVFVGLNGKNVQGFSRFRAAL
jgi:hypothetical protein